MRVPASDGSRIEAARSLALASGMKRDTATGRGAIVWVLREFAPEAEIAAQLVLNAEKRRNEAEEEAAKATAKAEKAAAKAAAKNATALVAKVTAAVPPPVAPVRPAGPPVAVSTKPVVPTTRSLFDPFDLNPRAPVAAKPAPTLRRELADDPFVL